MLKFKLTLALFIGFLAISQADTPIINKVPKELNPISEALTAHWGFLYERATPGFADETKKAPTVKRTQFQTLAIEKALQVLEKKGHRRGDGKVLVMGGGYEVNLTPLLENFAEVHVVDMSSAPLKLIAKIYEDNPRLKLFTADLSGVPVRFQGEQLKQMLTDVKDAATNGKTQLAFFQSMPKELEAIPFESGAYDMVISPVLVESLSHGPLVAVFEKHREEMKAERKGMSDLLGEPFYYQPAVMDVFARVYLHHSAELNRVLKPGGVATYSVWRRDDLKAMELAPQMEEELLRVGDDRMTWTNYQAFFKPWSKKHYLGGQQIYGVEKPPTMHMYLLEK